MSLYPVVGAAILGAAVALWQAIEAYRRRERGRLWRSAVAGVALIVVGTASLWVSVRYPNARFGGGQAFGPGWECENLGKGSAQVCFRDAPRLSERRPAPAQ